VTRAVANIDGRRSFLPYGRQTVEADDIEAVVSALSGDFLTTGPTVEAFEDAFAAATGAKYAVACNSGTAALHLAVLALGLKPGDAAIVPTLTFLATANVVRMCGAEVIFADVDPDTGLMTPETLREALNRVPAGVTVRVALPVHLNGRICDMPALAEIAAEAGMVLIEDACHALGAANAGATRYSEMACFSTHPVKAIATGEGGLITTSRLELADRMKVLRTHGMVRDPNAFENIGLGFDRNSPNPWYYEMSEIGWNYRLPDPLCALGMSQLKKLERFHARRCEIAALYDKLLAPLVPRIRPVPHADAAHGYHLYALLVDFSALGLTRRQAMEMLRKNGIGTQVHYLPVHLQPYYQRRYPQVSLPGADAYYARCLSIPFFPAMSDGDVEHVVRSLSNLAE
jgi:UDP-4-amino-4,6-dideoxy-N-acetyl-beta-L-altrosamine transaminase